MHLWGKCGCTTKTGSPTDTISHATIVRRCKQFQLVSIPFLQADSRLVTFISPDPLDQMMLRAQCSSLDVRDGLCAGCDGVVNMWDGRNQKRLCQLTGYPTSIAAMAFNADGSRLAIASSYTYESGEVEHPKDSIFVRAMAESEVRPKPKKLA